MTKKRLLRIALILLVCVLAAAYLLAPSLRRAYYRIRFEPDFLNRSSDLQLDPYLVAALIFNESRFRENAHSEAGAIGLMQLMPETAAEMAKEIGIRDFQPSHLEQGELNIRLGTLYLSKLLDRFQDENIALAAYNAGPTQVQKWLADDGNITFPETRAYVENIQKTKATLKILYPSWSQPGDSRASRETPTRNSSP